MMIFPRIGLALLALVALDSVALQVEVVATGLDRPWGLALLPNGDLLITERPGTLRLLSNGVLQPALPSGLTVLHKGQGGLLDVLADVDFAQNNVLYLSYAGGTESANSTRVARAQWTRSGLQSIREIYAATPTKNTSAHFGGRLLQLPDGSLLLGLGDGFDFREAAQDPSSHLGKIMRIDATGDRSAEVYSSGHRNVQGLVRDGDSGRVYAHDHGPKGGDEINLIERGNNYGWPLVSFGLDYSGALVTPFTTLSGYVDPMYQFTPSIAPSGMALYRGAVPTDWDGDLLITALADEALWRVPVRNGAFDEPIRLLGERKTRLRDVEIGPDGEIYILTDGKDAELWRMVL